MGRKTEIAGFRNDLTCREFFCEHAMSEMHIDILHTDWPGLNDENESYLTHAKLKFGQ